MRSPFRPRVGLRFLERSALLACSLLGGACSDDIVASPPPADLAPANRDSASLRLELMVSDVQRSVAFYTGVLGFALERAESDYASVRAGSVALGLNAAGSLGADHYFNPELRSQRRGLGAELVIEVADIGNYKAAVDKAGYATLSPLKKQSWGATDFRLADPDGYYVRLTSR